MTACRETETDVDRPESRVRTDIIRTPLEPTLRQGLRTEKNTKTKQIREANLAIKKTATRHSARVIDGKEHRASG